MITQPTVLILGAGASYPYGFPSGAQLVDSILEDLPDSIGSRQPARSPRRKDIFDLLSRAHGAEEVVSFRCALARSGKLSIDAFLESNPSHIREVGKSAIAAEILAAEQPSALWRRPENTEDWYRYFYSNILACKLTHLTSNRLTIITYNYDRSFEHFLVESFAADCGASTSVAADTVSQVPVLHLHGSLGTLPGFSKPNELPYGYELSGAALINAMRPRIRVISDPEVAKDVVFKRAHVALMESQRIYFMGFGWAPENLQRLIPQGLYSSNREVQGTCYHMGSAELNRCLLPFNKNKFVVEPRPVTCLDFLRNFAFELP